MVKLIRWLKQFVEDPEYKLCQIVMRFVKAERIPDRMFLKWQYRYVFGKPLNLKNPQTFNEKLQWLKLYDRNPLYTTLVDKYAVKQWVAEKIGVEHVIPTLAVFNSVDEIDLDKLPNQFVLKCNHDSGSVVICRDKSTFYLEEAKKKLQFGLNHNFYLKHREWAYKNVKPLVFAEQYLDFENEYLMDYRIYCFDGKPMFIYAYTNYAQKDGSKPDPSNCNYFDCDWNPLPFHQHSLPRGNVEKPKNLDEILQKARSIANNLKFARVDFYNTDIVRFGEITLYPGSGLSSFHPDEYDKLIGQMMSPLRQIH